MQAAELAREVTYPLRHFTTLVPMFVSWLLFSVAFIFGLLGLFLFVVTVVPFFGYAMSLLEARANGRDAPPFDAELMAFFGNVWALFPLVIVALLVWLHFVIAQNYSVGTAVFSGAMASTIFPAVLGVLSITQAPLQGLNPIALGRFVQSTGVDYVILIVTLQAISLVLYLLFRSGTPLFFLGLGLIYQVFLLYSMTGAIVADHKLTSDVHIPPPLTASAVQSRAELLAERQTIVTHAYGFASRGNRAGGLAHIQSQIDREYDPDEASQWFFNEMLKWENSDAALFFAQSYLHRLLQQTREPAALKVLSQCFHANPKFRPAEEDREVVIEIAERHGRKDLLKFLL